jgi:hypothetical protein
MLAAWSRNWLSTVFAGSYLAVAFLGATSVVLFVFAYSDQPDEAGPVATRQAPSEPCRPF